MQALPSGRQNPTEPPWWDATLGCASRADAETWKELCSEMETDPAKTIHALAINGMNILCVAVRYKRLEFARNIIEYAKEQGDECLRKLYEVTADGTSPLSLLAEVHTNNKTELAVLIRAHAAEGGVHGRPAERVRRKPAQTELPGGRAASTAAWCSPRFMAVAAASAVLDAAAVASSGACTGEKRPAEVSSSSGGGKLPRQQDPTTTAPMHSKPRGRAPTGCHWDSDRGVWVDASGDVRPASKKKLDPQLADAQQQMQSSGPHVGSRVRRHFPDDGVFGGVVTGYLPAEGEDSALWRVRHDDGDEEDLDEAEVRVAIDMHQQAQQQAEQLETAQTATAAAEQQKAQLQQQLAEEKEARAAAEQQKAQLQQQLATATAPETATAAAEQQKAQLQLQLATEKVASAAAEQQKAQLQQQLAEEKAASAAAEQQKAQLQLQLATEVAAATQRTSCEARNHAVQPAEQKASLLELLGRASMAEQV